MHTMNQESEVKPQRFPEVRILRTAAKSVVGKAGSTCLILAILCAMVSSATRAATPGSAEPTAEKIARVRKLIESLNPQKGKVTLKDGLATLTLPDGLLYLDPKDTRTVLVDLWANPPASVAGSLGMLIPSVRAILQANGWGVVMSYTEEGHVDDADAAKIKFDKLLQEMKTGVAEASKERVKSGFPSIELMGWAEQPHYDAMVHKLYWAKELAFNGRDRTLNYCVRILGRRGVLELNAVAPIESLPAIRTQAQKVLASVEFNPGNRYADYNQSTDKLATYGLAALVAGGVAGKMGLFKVILAAVLAAKKFVIIGVLALVGVVKKWFGKSEVKQDL